MSAMANCGAPPVVAGGSTGQVAGIAGTGAVAPAVAYTAAPTPVYATPAPVYATPAPVYTTPAPVYAAPAPIYPAPAAAAVQGAAAVAGGGTLPAAVGTPGVVATPTPGGGTTLLMSSGESAAQIIGPQTTQAGGTTTGGGGLVNGLDAATRQEYGLGEFNTTQGGGGTQSGAASGGCGMAGCGGAKDGANGIGKSPTQSPVQQAQDTVAPKEEAGLDARRKKILAAARKELGKRESGGENRGVGKYSQAVLGSPLVAPWCAFFVSYVYQQAGVKLGPDGKGHGYVPTITDWAKKAGRLYSPTKRPEPGDLIIFQRGSRPDHIGIVEKVDLDGRVHTIEGNASDMVTRRSYAHNSSQVVGYVKAV